MKKLLRELKSVINEYGLICIGICLLAVCWYGTGWIFVCGLVYGVTWILNLTYSWTVSTIVWIVTMVILKFVKKRVENEMYSSGWI